MTFRIFREALGPHLLLGRVYQEEQPLPQFSCFSFICPFSHHSYHPCFFVLSSVPSFFSFPIRPPLIFTYPSAFYSFPPPFPFPPFPSFFRSLLFCGGKIIMRNACQVSGASQFKGFWERTLNRDSKFR